MSNKTQNDPAVRGPCLKASEAVRSSREIGKPPSRFNRWRATFSSLLALIAIQTGCPSLLAELTPIPDKLVVLTFDDSVASQYHVVRPILKKYGFGATFFITEGFSFPTNKTDYMTWGQIKELHEDGFEIGNHTRDHFGISSNNVSRLTDQLEAINARCAQHGIPRPVSFAYPGNGIHPNALPILRQLGIRFARRGGAPEFSYDQGEGSAYEPGLDHPLLIPSAGDARPAWTLANFVKAATLAKKGRIAVLQFHGVPDRDHPWVNTPEPMFAQYMEFLHSNHYQVIALRDLTKFVDSDKTPLDPMAIIDERKNKRRSP